MLSIGGLNCWLKAATKLPRPIPLLHRFGLKDWRENNIPVDGGGWVDAAVSYLIRI